MDNASNEFNFAAPFGGILQILLAAGYNLSYCILELLDNSISKKSKHICLKLSADKNNGPLTRITVSDDGVGMNYQQLCESFVISQLPKDRNDDDIGKFGVGMKSAIMNMGTNISIISKVANDKPVVGLNADIEMMKTNNTYKPTFLSKDISKQFPDCLEVSNSEYFKKHSSGTLVQVDRIRQLCAIPLKDAFNEMRLMIANSYHTMPEGSTITLETNQGESIVIRPTDFFYTKDESLLDEKPYTTNIHVYERNEGELYDQVIEVNTTSRNLTKKFKCGKPDEPIYYKYKATPTGQRNSVGTNMERISSLPKTRLLGIIQIRVIQVSYKQFRTEEIYFGNNLHKDRKGFWFSRGIRSIGFGKRIGKKLHDRTALCVERQRMHVSFPASLDDHVGSKFNKQMEDNALPSQTLTDALFLIYNQVTCPWTKKWKTISVKEEQESDEEESSSDDQTVSTSNIIKLNNSTTFIETPTVTVKEPVVVAKEPVVVAKEPVVVAKDPVVVANEPVVVAKEPVVVAKEPVVIAKNPFVEPNAPRWPPLPIKAKMSTNTQSPPSVSEEEEDDDSENVSISSSVPSQEDETNEIVQSPHTPIYTHSVVNGNLIFMEDDKPTYTLKSPPCVDTWIQWWNDLLKTDLDSYKKHVYINVQSQEFNG